MTLVFIKNRDSHGEGHTVWRLKAEIGVKCPLAKEHEGLLQPPEDREAGKDPALEPSERSLALPIPCFRLLAYRNVKNAYI